MRRARIAIGSLALSAAGLVGIITSESYTDRAIVPTKNDRPTVGYGSTFYENGAPVKMGDTITPPRAIRLASAHISKEEQIFRNSLPGVALQQAEYDVYVDWTYQYGTGTWVSSSMRRELLAGNYRAACGALLAYKKAGGRDCSLPANWGPQGCKGVWTRQIERHKQCMEVQ